MISARTWTVSLLIWATLLWSGASCGRGQEFDVEKERSGQKNYTKDEEGKILPTRTFLTTLEIVLLCVFGVLLFLVIVLCCLYVYCFGCTCPKCCKSCCHRRRKEEYTQVQLHRERKIAEIWRTNYNGRA